MSTDSVILNHSDESILIDSVCLFIFGIVSVRRMKNDQKKVEYSYLLCTYFIVSAMVRSPTN